MTVAHSLKSCLLGGASALLMSAVAAAQEPPKASEDPAIAQTPRPAPQAPVPSDQIDREAASDARAQAESEVEEVVVVGSQIRGARVTDALPVTVMDTEDIENTAATSGD